MAMIPEGDRLLEGLDASSGGGLPDAEAGRVAPAKEVFDRLERKYRTLGQKKVDPGSSPG